MLGDDDVVVNSAVYQTTVRCLSPTAELYEINKEEFLRLQQMGQNAWKEVVVAVSNKR